MFADDSDAAATAAPAAAPATTREAELLVLVVPPTPRDGAAAARSLGRVDVTCAIVPTLREVIRRLSDPIGALVISDFALVDPAFEDFAVALANQPAWSDIPVVLMIRSDAPTSVLDAHRRLSNVTLVDRPTSVRTLTSAVLAALRARGRQFEIRDRIDALERVQSALHESDRRKDEFLATLAHELRNPLAPIRNAAYILAKLPASQERTAELAEMISRQTGAMAALLEDLLDVARITSGKLALKLEDVAVRTVVATAVEAARPLVDAKGHDLKVHLPEPDALLRVDPLRLAQVLTNVLTNAAKYTDARGHIDLDVEVRDGRVKFVVRDDGVGIEAHVLPHLFEMFIQVEGTLDRSQGGLGIGLALSRALIGLHGGSIEGLSAGKGCGSTFRIVVPIGVPSDRREEEIAAPASAAAPALQHRRIAVVDDNRDAADSMAAMLSLQGWDVDVAYGGVAGLAHADTHPPAAMLLDIGMPDMDGYEVARRLRTQRWGPDVLLIATTGWSQPEDKRRAFDAGFDAHLTKPIFPEHVMALLQERLPRLERWKPAQAS